MRRGTVTAVITDLTIDKSNMMLACASDQGTIHLFKIGAENTKSTLSSLGGLSSYFGSSWSTAQFRVSDQFCKVAILNGKIYAISCSGQYYMGEITQDGGTIEVKVD